MDELKKEVEEEVKRVLSSSKTDEEKEKELKDVIGSIVEKFKDKIKPENIEKTTDEILEKVKKSSEEIGYDAGKVAGWVVEGFKDKLEKMKEGEKLAKEFVKASVNSAKKMGLTMMKLPITFFKEFMEGMKEK